MDLDRGTLLAIAIAALWLLHHLWGRLRAALARAAQRRRVRRGLRAEGEAEELLEAHGFRVVERQAIAFWPVDCGEDRCEIRLRADLLVERDGLYVAEVKTGDLGPDVGNAGTRRQLLEYLLAYPVRGVLLVDIDAGLVEEVRFPALELALESRDPDSAMTG